MNDIIKALQFEKEQLEAKNRLLQEKIESDNRQISEYDHELRQAKRLLKSVVEDFREINSDILTCKYCKWYSVETVECAYYHDDVPCEQICGWKHEGEALKLIGGEADE